MTAESLAEFSAMASRDRAAVFGRNVRIAGILCRAVFTPPRVAFSLDESTAPVNRYTSTLVIRKEAVPQYATPAAWRDVTIQLPEANGWRDFEIVGDVAEVEPEGEWRLNLQTL